MNNSRTEIFFKNVIEARWYICILFGFIAIFGFYSLSKIKIDAIPDITNKQVIVNTKTYGMEPTRIEKSVTYPIEAEFYGIPGLTEMRSISKFGLSQVILIFRDDVDIYFARNQVLQRISALGDKLPSNLRPEIAPLTTGIGEIIIYRVVAGGNENLMELRTTQQFQIARELKKVQGVAEVDTIGGFERELHLNVDSAKITSYGLTPEKLVNQIQTVGENFGGGYIEQDGEQKIVRTFSGIKNFDDIMNIPVKIDYTGKALPLNHIVEVSEDYTQRLGAATYKGEETVIGTVMLQSGYNAKEVLINIKKEIEEWNKNNSVKIEILYDRQFLIDSTIKTVMKNLSEGILLVVVVLFLLLGNFRVGLIVASCLPFCILILASCMNIFGISANLMSLGAIDFGLLVDSSVVLIEYVVAHLLLTQNSRDKIHTLSALVSQVFKPVFFGIIIITLVYIPILLFDGIEGKTFKPMAINVIIAMLSSLFVALLLMPVLAFFFISGSTNHESKFFNIIKNSYEKILKFSLQKEKLIVLSCVGLFGFSMLTLRNMPSDFLPELNEGDVVYTVVTKEGTSLTKTKDIIEQLEKNIAKEKQVEKTFSRVAVSEAGLDLMPQNSADLFVIIKKDYKNDALNIGDTLHQKIKNDFLKDCEDCEISSSQPIKMRFNEMLEGSRADLSLKIFGEDLGVLMNVTEKIKSILEDQSQIKEIEEDFINRVRKGKFIDVIPNYEQISRQQISISDVNNDLKNSMAGIRVGSFYATEFPIAIMLHLNESSRNKLESIANIPIGVSDGGSFPLRRVAEIVEGDDITSIPRFFGKRYSSLSIYLNDTDYTKFISVAEKKITENKILPDGYNIKWSGRFENFNSAKKQILAAIPLIILVIAMLLFKMFGNWKKILIIFSSVPFALSGAIILLALCQIPITISVYIGFIALIGISLLNSIILINTFKTTRNLFLTCTSRLRPILMTAIVASLGFLPMAFGHGIGAEVQQPIAITVIGGIISSTIATLVLSPVLLKKFLIKEGL